MNRVTKAIVIALAAVVTIAVALIIGINLYVESPGAQARIQEELSKALNLPLKITNTSVTPWSDLRINGITIPAETGNFLEAASFSARYRLWPIFQRRLVIYEMRIESPKIVWTQNAEGKWVLPALAKAPAEAAAQEPRASEKEEKPPSTGEDSKESDFQVLLDGFKISNGSIEFYNREQRRVAQLAGVQMDYTVLAAERVEGTVVIAHANYADMFSFADIRTPFKYMGGQFTLPALEAAVAGGTVAGSLELTPGGKDSPFNASVKLQGIDAARLSREAGWQSIQPSGTLAGALDLRGSSREIARAEGRGNVSLRNGQLRQLELLQTIGEVLQINELANLRLKNATADFHLADEKVFIDGMELESADVKLFAQGIARYDGKLTLDARLSIDPRLAKKLPGFARDSFTTTDTGASAIDFKITGKTDRPKTDLAEKLVGKKLGDQFESLVSSLFGTKKKKEDEKKKDEKNKRKKELEKPAAPPPPTENPAQSPAGRPRVIPPATPAPTPSATSPAAIPSEAKSEGEDGGLRAVQEPRVATADAALQELAVSLSRLAPSFS